MKIPSFWNLSSSVSKTLWQHLKVLLLFFKPLSTPLSPYNLFSLLEVYPLHADIFQDAILILFSLSHGLNRSHIQNSPGSTSPAQLPWLGSKVTYSIVIGMSSEWFYVPSGAHLCVFILYISEWYCHPLSFLHLQTWEFSFMHAPVNTSLQPTRTPMDF